MPNPDHVEDGAYDYQIVSNILEKEIEGSFNDIFVDLQFVKDEIWDLERLVMRLVDRDKKIAMPPPSTM